MTELVGMAMEMIGRLPPAEQDELALRIICEIGKAELPYPYQLLARAHAKRRHLAS